MSIRVNDVTYDAEYLNPDQFHLGAAGRKELNGCIVFNMGKGHHSFWMKGCLIPLDIVFVSNNRISKIHTNCQPSGNQLNPPKFSGIGDHVLEFPAGTCSKWKIGDRVNMYLGTKLNPAF